MANNAPDGDADPYDLSLLAESMIMLEHEDVPTDSSDSTGSNTIPTTLPGPRSNPFRLLLPDNSTDDVEVQCLFSRQHTGSNQQWNRPLLDDMTHEADRHQAKEERLMNDINNLHSQVADGKKVIKKMKKKLSKVKGNLATTMEESAHRRETTRTVAEQRDALFNVATQLVRTIKDLQDTKPNEQALVNLPQSGEVGLVDVCLLLKYIQMILECNGIKGLDQSEEARLHTAVSRTAVLVDDALAYAHSKTQANESSPPAASGSSEKPPVKDFDELEASSFFTGLAIPSEPQLGNETKSDNSSNPVVTKDVKGSDSPSEENMEGDENDSSQVTAPKDPDRSSVKIWFDLTCCGWNVCWY